MKTVMAVKQPAGLVQSRSLGFKSFLVTLAIQLNLRGVQFADDR